MERGRRWTVLTAQQLLELPIYIGQRSLSYVFEVVDGATGVRKGQVTPVRNSPPQLSHDSTATISRRLSSLLLGQDDAARFDSLSDRIEVWMELGDRDRTRFPLGRYMSADAITGVYSSGPMKPLTLFDEMFIVDQQMRTGFDAAGQLVDEAARRLLEGLPINELVVDFTPFTAANGWAAGTSRAKVLGDLATLGGYFKPWFDHTSTPRMIAAFEPGNRPPDIDFDTPARVFQDSISRSDDLLDAPNVFVVVSNNDTPAVGVYEVPSSAPHSVARRGFELPDVQEAQVSSQVQASAYARALGIQQTIFERVELSTPPDPRHDSYQVVKWDGQLWLEIGWALTLTPDGPMRHTLRRAYPSTGEVQVL